MRVKLNPAVATTLLITLGWYYPHRDHYGVIYGNQYQHSYQHAQDAAWGLLPPKQRHTELTQVLQDIRKLHTSFYSTSLPAWLADQLINSLSHVRSAMWFATCPGWDNIRSVEPIWIQLNIMR